MHGDIKGLRFGDLPAYAGVHDPVLIDCSDLMRIDFVSAGMLLNVLSTVRDGGKQIVFRHPNHSGGRVVQDCWPEGYGDRRFW